MAIFQEPPPLPQNAPLVDPKTGMATIAFQRWWQQVTGNADFTQGEVSGLAIATTAPISGGGNLSAGVTLTHDDTAVTPGAYTSANITVDAKGHVTAAANGSGGSTAWALAGTGTGHAAAGFYDFATDGAQAVMNFTGLGSFNELLIIARGVSYTVSGVRIVYVSVDNGSTFFTTNGDYVLNSGAGVETATVGISHSTATTAVRTLVVHIKNTKGAVKAITAQSASTMQVLFVASASDINAIQFTNSAGGNSGAGTVRVFAR